MKSNDDKLTRQNVDEQIEECLSLLKDPQHPTITPLAWTIQDLQSIYEEDRRLEHVWARINSRVSALNAVRVVRQTEEQRAAASVTQSPVYRTKRLSRRLPRLGCLIIGTALIAAMILTNFFAWPIWSQALHGLQTQLSTHEGTPQTQPTVQGLNMNTHIGQYFKLQYPVNWVITSGTPKDSSLQTVQFRPSATSTVFVNADAMPASLHSAYQLLQADPDAKLGTVQSTGSTTIHGLPWVIAIIEITGPANAPARKLEIAYTNQGIPYRIEFGAPSDVFSTYTQIFNSIFASFYSQTESPATVPSPTTN